jgi:hypothetical protein
MKVSRRTLLAACFTFAMLVSVWLVGGVHSDNGGFGQLSVNSNNADDAFDDDDDAVNSSAFPGRFQRIQPTLEKFATISSEMAVLARDYRGAAAANGERVFLHSVWPVEYYGPIFRRFLDHYKSLGVVSQNFLLLLHATNDPARNATTAAALAATKTLLSAQGIHPRYVVVGDLTSVDLQAVSSLLLTHFVKSPLSWIVHAEPDEFHMFPRGAKRDTDGNSGSGGGGDDSGGDDLPAFLQACACTVVRGQIVDHAAGDCSLPRLRAGAADDGGDDVWTVLPRKVARSGETYRKAMAYQAAFRVDRWADDIDAARLPPSDVSPLSEATANAYVHRFARWHGLEKRLLLRQWQDRYQHFGWSRFAAWLRRVADVERSGVGGGCEDAQLQSSQA